MNRIDESLLIELLEKHKGVSARESQMAERGRTRFLAQAAQLQESKFRQKDQVRFDWSRIFRKENLGTKTIAAALAVLLLLFSATTALAAQNDLPNDPLYGVKVFGEDAALWFTTDTNEKFEQLMQLAETRVQEISALSADGEAIPAHVTERLQAHIETALQLAARQDNANMRANLLQIRSQLQAQEQRMAQLQNNASAEDKAVLEHARTMTQEHLRLINEGLKDPDTFRNHYGLKEPEITRTPISATVTVPSGQATTSPSGNAPESPPQPTPGAENSPILILTPNGGHENKGEGPGSGGGGGGGGNRNRP